MVCSSEAEGHRKTMRFCGCPTLCRLLFNAAVISMSTSYVALAQPFIPDRDDQVMAVLPATSNTAAATNASAQGKLITDAERIKRAQILLTHAYESNDEDAFGQAEALLTKWNQEVELGGIPSEVQYMLAVIRQHNHEFSAALELLNQMLRDQPKNAVALLQRAQIHLVLGNYELSQLDCQNLVGAVSNAAVANCTAQVKAVTGNAKEVQAQLVALAGLKAVMTPADHIELLITLATVSHRLGLTSEADNYYKYILEYNNNHLYAILQYCDLLLEQERFADVLDLLRPFAPEQMTLELQVKQMEAFLGSGETHAYATARHQLEEIFRVAQTRAENFPHKEYARFLLGSADLPLLALNAAKANWLYQKEPGDLLLLVRAAAAANSVVDIDLAKDWLLKTGLEDNRISRLLENYHPRSVEQGTEKP